MSLDSARLNIEMCVNSLVVLKSDKAKLDWHIMRLLSDSGFIRNQQVLLCLGIQLEEEVDDHDK